MTGIDGARLSRSPRGDGPPSGERAENESDTRATLRRAPAIGVFGHYGNCNLGDEAIIEALIARLRGEWPDVQLRAFSASSCGHALAP